MKEIKRSHLHRTVAAHSDERVTDANEIWEASKSVEPRPTSCRHV